MPFFFVSRPPLKWSIWLGKDKYENDELIKWGWPNDIWFHVDDLPSAHAYIRLPDDVTIDNIPEDVLEDCCQLVKNNSIQGCKLPSVTVVYTKWSNLKKTNGMDVGQVSFHDDKAVKRRKCNRSNQIVKVLEKSKEDRPQDLKALREERDRQERIAERLQKEEDKRVERKKQEDKQKADDLKHYKDLMVDDLMHTNKDNPNQNFRDYEDSFM